MNINRTILVDTKHTDSHANGYSNQKPQAREGKWSKLELLSRRLFLSLLIKFRNIWRTCKKKLSYFAVQLVLTD